MKGPADLKMNPPQPDMPGIITITFSPCIDKSTSVPALIAEKKLKCAEPLLKPGGGGINVARAITKLGGRATAIFPSGGYTGKYFNHLLAKENIPVVIIETEQETRENIIILDKASGNQYRFGMPATALTTNEYSQILQAVEKSGEPSFIIVSGSLPPFINMNVYEQIGLLAKKVNAKLIIDAAGENLQRAAAAGVYLMKPNLGELSLLAGKKRLEISEVYDAAAAIIKKGTCEVVVVSMGADGAMLVTVDGAETIKAPTVIKKSTVGAGDSMVAGIVYFLSQGKDLSAAVQYGVACGTAATMNEGTELCHKQDADQLYELIREGKEQHVQTIVNES